jgi:hypothetical protein
MFRFPSAPNERTRILSAVAASTLSDRPVSCRDRIGSDARGATDRCRSIVSRPGSVRRTGRSALWSLLAAAVLLPIGCGGEQRLAVHPVQGRLVDGGQPLVGAMVVFHPTDVSLAELSPRGTTDADGRFVLTTFDTADGAPAGDYVITVLKFETVEGPNGIEPGPNVLDRSLADRTGSPFRFTVVPGPNTVPDYDVRR